MTSLFIKILYYIIIIIIIIIVNCRCVVLLTNVCSDASRAQIILGSNVTICVWAAIGRH